MPANIPARNSETKGDCSGKCNLSFKYQASACTVTNEGDHLSLGYEHNDSQVVYNNSNYKVEDIRLYTPSVNTFNGSSADAELVVLHKNNHNKYLAVCVPIKKDNTPNPFSDLLHKIIAATPVNTGSRTNVSVSNYSLNHFIPKAPFYSYVKSLPWDASIKNVNFVVFNTSETIGKIDDITFNRLTSLINKKRFRISPMTSVFRNPKGSTGIGGTKDDDQIYIMCDRVTDDEVNKTMKGIEIPQNNNTTASGTAFSNELISTIGLVITIIGTIVLFAKGIIMTWGWWKRRQSRSPFRMRRPSTSSSRTSFDARSSVATDGSN